MLNIYLTTLGCPKNQVDSEHLKRGFMSEGFIFVDSPDDADVFVVNTCGFIRDAKEESIEEILFLAKKKADFLPEIRKNNGGSKKLLVFGCLTERYRDEIKKEIPEIDALWGVAQEKEIIEYCKKLNIAENTINCKSGEDPQASKKILLNNRSSFAYIKIAEGCDKKCTFCIIPAIRGRFKSIPPDDIIKEAKDFIRQGIKELILVAQDITNYGRDLRGDNLISLLKDLTAIEGDFRVRLLYLYPASISDELLELIASNEKICKYLDIPFQHSEDRILRLMGRRGTKKEYIKLLRNIRRRIPGIAIRTTFIAGFPSETEDEFLSLIDFIEEMRFDRLGVFKYSKEDGTPAEKLRGQIPEKIKNRRYDEIMKIQSFISLQKNKEMIGRRFRALVDEIDGNVAIARLYCHAPEIDGVVIINNRDLDTVKNLKSKPNISTGDFVNVEIIEAFDYDLESKII